MATDDNQNLKNIDFNHDWKFYCQTVNDLVDVKTILLSANNSHIDQHWTAITLPHIIDTIKDNKRSFKWWYCKKFDWTTTSQNLKQQVYLDFEPSQNHNKKSNIDATIWLNGTQIYSGSLTLINVSIELSSKLLYSENKHDNILVICCTNTTLSLYVYLRIYGKVIYAMGQVVMDEHNIDRYSDIDKKPNDILDYKVSVDDADGRIDVTFNPKRKSKIPSRALSFSYTSESNVHEEQNNEVNENVDDDLLVPRLAIVILIVGTRGDVQPFIA